MNSYEASREEVLREMARDFYSRKMRSAAILVYGSVAAFVSLAIYSAIQFFKAIDTRGQILFAALFNLAAHGIGLMKILAWGILNQHSIRRDIKHLELRVAELAEALKGK